MDTKKLFVFTLFTIACITSPAFADRWYNKDGNWLGWAEINRKSWNSNPMTKNIEFPDVQTLSDFDPAISDWKGTFYSYPVVAGSRKEATSKVRDQADLALNNYLLSLGFDLHTRRKIRKSTKFYLKARRKRKRSFSFSTGNHRFLAGYEWYNGKLTPSKDYVIRGASWSPYNIGEAPYIGGVLPDFKGWVYKDAPLMRGGMINTVKTYFPLPQTQESLTVLDILHAHDISMIMTVFANKGVDGDYLEFVEYFKDHPAILMWGVGNEFNYNRLFAGIPGLYSTIDIVNEVVTTIKQADPDHAISVGWGWFAGQPEFGFYANRICGDVFGLNIYPVTNFEENGDFFKVYDTIVPDKPVFLAEFGTDSFVTTNVADLPQTFDGSIPFGDSDSPQGAEDEAAQAAAVVLQADNIGEHLSAFETKTEAVAVGGTVFEWNDEWWKASKDNDPFTQNRGGLIVQGSSAVPPDGAFNEEYFGIVDIFRNPKEAYYSLRESYKKWRKRAPKRPDVSRGDALEVCSGPIIAMTVPTSDRFGVFTDDPTIDTKVDLSGQTTLGANVFPYAGNGDQIDFQAIDSTSDDGGVAFSMTVTKNGGFSGFAIDGSFQQNNLEGRFDLTNYKTLRFSLKGGMADVGIQIRHTEIQFVDGSYTKTLAASDYGYNNDDSWNDLSVPLNDFGDDVNWKAISMLVGFTTLPQLGGTLEVDNIYYDVN